MSEIEAHYDVGYETERLSEGDGKLEWLRTMEIFGRYAPPPPARVLDVGGGPGAYALPLARQGYEVHLVDFVPLHVEQAQNAAERQPDHPLASARVGDARDLPFGDDEADIVLMLGPLYHLTERSDRHAALREAMRALKSGGLLLAAAISRFASTFDGLTRDFLLDPAFEDIVKRDLREGQHRNDSDRPGWFTTAYFHHPDELATEVEQSGFALDSVVAVEGPGGLLPNLDRWLSDPEEREILLRAIRRVETEPSLLGSSSHLLSVARKP